MCPPGPLPPRTVVQGPSSGPYYGSHAVSLVQPEEAVLAGCAGLATHVGACRSTGRVSGGRREKQPGLGGSLHCSHGPSTSAPVFTGWHWQPTQRAPGITVAAWGRGRAGLRVTRGRRAGPSPTLATRGASPPLRRVSPSTPTPLQADSRYSLRVARTQPPESRFTAVVPPREPGTYRGPAGWEDETGQPCPPSTNPQP